MTAAFNRIIYKTGINWCVDVPLSITKKFTPVKGYIRVKGTINGGAFEQTLVPVKSGPYRLFVNAIMMKAGKTALGERAFFELDQIAPKTIPAHPMPLFLKVLLEEQQLSEAFDALSSARKRDVINYLLQVRGMETRERNLANLILQLKNGERNVRIPQAGYMSK